MNEPFQMDSLENLVRKARARLRAFIPADGRPYYLCDSGGKDSCVIRRLAQMEGVPFVSHYNVTTIDPPELVRFIRRFHADTRFERAPMPFHEMIIKKQILPTVGKRWCCSIYKERKLEPGNVKILGVRAEESKARADRAQYTKSHLGSLEISIILEWKSSDVWEFIRSENIPYCELYDQGFERIGCVGCPLAGRRMRLLVFQRWPKFKVQILQSLRKIHSSKSEFQTVEDWFEWWMLERRETLYPVGCGEFFKPFDQS